MIKRRNFIALCAAFAVSACAGAAPKESVLEEATRSNLRITEVVVDVSKMGEKTKGRAVPAANVKAALQQASDALLKGQGSGKRAARANIDVTSVVVINGAQSVLIGGESVMRGTITLVDAKTGAVIVPASELTAGGGGWVAGGIIAAATQEDPATELRQMSQEYASRARTLVFGNGPQRTAQVQSVTAAGAADADGAASKAPKETMEEYNRRMKCRNSIKNCPS